MITTFSDTTCTNVKSTTTVQQAAMGLGLYGLCLDEVTGFYGGPRPNLTAIAIYEDDKCSRTPTQLRFSQDFVCFGTTDAPCQSYDNSRFSTAGCTSDFWVIQRVCLVPTVHTWLWRISPIRGAVTSKM